jgi:hypothetical protein
MPDDPTPETAAGRRPEANGAHAGVWALARGWRVLLAVVFGVLVLLGSDGSLRAAGPVPCTAIQSEAGGGERVEEWKLADPAPVELEGFAEERDPEEEEEGPGVPARSAGLLRHGDGRLVDVHARSVVRAASVADSPAVRGPPAR